MLSRNTKVLNTKTTNVFYLVNLVSLLCLFVPPADAYIDTPIWVAKAQLWANSWNDRAYTADVNCTSNPGDPNSKTFLMKLWFQDDINDGWSSRTDITITDVNNCGDSLVYTIIDTPNGCKAFLDSNCVYTSDDDLVDSWVSQPHDGLPVIFYNGYLESGSIWNLYDMSISTAASETIFNGQSVYKLEVTWDVNCINSKIKDPNYHMDPNYASMTGTYYIESVYGTPVQTDEVVNNTTDPNFAQTIRSEWCHIEDDPNIPEGTFDLTSQNPSMTFEEAYDIWLSNHCN